MGEYVEQLRNGMKIRRHPRKRKKLPKPKNTENEYTLAPLEAAGLLTANADVAKGTAVAYLYKSHFNPDEPRDPDGKWALLAALRAALEDEEDHGPEYPRFDQHASFDAVHYKGEPVKTNDLLNGGAEPHHSSVGGKANHSALNDYVVNDSTTRDINTKLRKGESLSEEEKLRNERLDEVGRNATLNKDSDMWRGAILSPDQIASLTPGAEVTDNGYASASPNRQVAEFYSHTRQQHINGERVLFHIRGKKGNNVIPVRGDEFVIPRGQKMKVIRNENGVVEVEYA